MSVDLEQVVLDGGRRFVNFFEGRILTGRDLRDEQSAARQGRTTLGKAIGWGISDGLQVSDATPSGDGALPAVRVTAGLAVNREGQTIHLSSDRTVRLAVLDIDDPARDAGAFDICADQPSDSSAPTAEGFHILTVAPATGYEEEAPRSGLEDSGVAGGCGRRYVTLGVRFRLVRFDPAQLASDSTGATIGGLALATGDAAVSRLRNLVAHLGLGTEARADFPDNPFATMTGGASVWSEWELESQLLDGANPPLSACEVPLAVLRLRAGQISFVDMWTMRRQLRTPAVDPAWPLIDASARKATDAATVFQFQEHLAWLFSRVTEPASIVANSHFQYLPPVGFLPLGSAASFLPAADPPIGLAPGRVIPLVQEAMAYPAVDLTASSLAQFTIYRVGEAPGWLLFVSNEVPSAEREAIKCAELEARIDNLEDVLAAPGMINGSVTITYVFGQNQFSNPIPGISVQAQPVGDTTEAPTVVTTNADGEYTMTLPPGNYTLSLVGTGVSQFGLSRSIEVVSGATLTENFDFNQSTISSVQLI